MIKVMLDMSMPTSCMGCPFAGLSSSDVNKALCYFLDSDMLDSNWTTERHPNCPLKEA